MKRQRLQMELQGAVQGVGFRPFVYRLAAELDLCGWVRNDSRGVFLELEGAPEAVEAFARRLKRETPPQAQIHKERQALLEPVGYANLEIRHSEEMGRKTVVVLPDLATCADCRQECSQPDDRRFGYPFTNCTNCGPRYSIVRELPYDRRHTTMRGFVMCEDCQREYDDPLDRRFHAQPNACPVCGPQVALKERDGALIARGKRAIEQTSAALGRGLIIALKGIGGFQLLVDATNPSAVQTLRARKRRPSKPLALMVRDVQTARTLCEVSREAAEALESPAAPILVLPRRQSDLASNVAPDNPTLGLMLPYSPLHHELMAAVDTPIVATSGNLSEEPICIDETEAFTRLGDIADLFLIHDRPIERHVDDSVAWMAGGELRLLRRARGFAPLPIVLAEPVPTILALGAHQKNSVALGMDENVFISQHIGDLETLASQQAFERVLADLLALYEARPVAIAHDLHPDYFSSRWPEVAAGREDPHVARAIELLAQAPRIGVQHHHAHMASCLAENGVKGEALGITWDGTGFGNDKTVWGGEFLRGNASHFERVATLRPFRLLGGEAAVREPARVALALLYETFGPKALEMESLAPVAFIPQQSRASFARMLESGARSPSTTSAGRLFDGIAAIIGLEQRVSFEGEAAISLEHAADVSCRDAYPLRWFRAETSENRREADAPEGMRQEAETTSGSGDRPLQLDWCELVAAIVDDLQHGTAREEIAARFHETLVAAIVAIAEQETLSKVVLSGGCFQNRLLSTRAALALEQAGFTVYAHRRVPANDGGISLGQVAVAAARLQHG